MNTGSYFNTSTANRGRKALLFLLTLLVLVISCPFKRLLLQNESTAQDAGQTSAKWSGAERKMAAYQNTCSCAQKNKIALVKTATGKVKLPALDFVARELGQTGYSLHYYLSGLEKHYQDGSTNVHALPLFLQHRRLLI